MKNNLKYPLTLYFPGNSSLREDKKKDHSIRSDLLVGVDGFEPPTLCL